MEPSTPDIVGGFSYGDRFFGGRLGVMAAFSYQNLFRGKDASLYYIPGSAGKGTENRAYSDEQNRMGAHVKLDYRFSGRHKLMLYAGYMDLRESEVRDGYNDQERTVRMRWNHQYIFNTTLKGEHSFLRADRLKLDWTGVFSKAHVYISTGIIFITRIQQIAAGSTTATGILRGMSIFPTALTSLQILLWT